MGNKKTNNKTLDYAKIFVLIVFFIISLSPKYERNVPMIVNIFILIIWTALAFLNNPDYFLKPNKLVVSLFLLVFYMVLQQLLGISDQYIGNLYRYLTFWYLAIMSDYSLENYTNVQLKSILIITIIILGVNLFLNISELTNDPSLSKYVTAFVGADNQIIKNSHVGNYLFAFIISIVSIIFLQLLLKSKNKVIVLISLVMFLSSIYMVVLSSSVITIIALFLIVFMYFYFFITKNNFILKTIFIFSMVLLFLIALINEQSIYNKLDSFRLSINNVLISNRFNEIINFIYIKDSEVSFSGRKNLYIKSFNTFINNPIFGVGRDHGYKSGRVGLHSQILDDLAFFGLVGGILYFYILYKFYEYHLKDSNNNNEIKKSSLIGLLFFSLLNPVININFGVLLFFILPSYFILTDKNKEIDLKGEKIYDKNFTRSLVT